MVSTHVFPLVYVTEIELLSEMFVTYDNSPESSTLNQLFFLFFYLD